MGDPYSRCSIQAKSVCYSLIYSNSAESGITGSVVGLLWLTTLAYTCARVCEEAYLSLN